MSRRGMLVVIVLVAVVALFWLLGGAGLFAPGEGPGEDDRGGNSPSLLEDGVGQGAAGEGEDATGRGPVLFGRAKEQRKGLGDLAGRVMDFGSGEVMAGARIVVTGTGYGDEPVSARAVTGANGHFQLADLAAGDGYSVHVVGGAYQRTLAGVSVDADGLRDLGTIWLGERGALEGVVLDSEGAGLEGARVAVHRGGSLLDILSNLPVLMEQMDRDPVPLERALTERGGRFRVEGLDPGPINVVVRAAGHRQRMVKTVMTEQGAPEGSLTIRLEAAAALAGVVVDERGRGVGGARVACMDQNDMDQAFYGRQFTQTDDEGRFRIDSPPALPQTTVIVAAEGYPTLFARTAVGDGELRLVLKGGAEVVLRVLEAKTGRAIPGARVMAMFGDEVGLGDRSTNYAYGITDDRGEAFMAARPGKLQMLFFHHAERGTGIYAPAMPIGAASIIQGPEDPTVKAPRTTLVFRVDTGITIRGRVADPVGNPIAGARCQVIGSMGIGATVLSDAEGNYLVRGQSTQVQFIVVTAPGYVQQLPGRGGLDRPGQPDARGEVVFDVVMLPAASVTGRVVDPRGQPVAGARVKAGPSAVDVVTNMLGAAREGVTNAAGRYVLDGVRPGDKIRVLVRLAGFTDAKSAEFAVRAGEVTDAPDVVMKRGARITVHVTDPEGRPVAKARVEADLSPHEEEQVGWDPMSRWRAFADLLTDADGQVVLTSLPSGSVTVTVTHEAFAGVRRTVPVERLQDGGPTATDLRVRLREAYALRGRVVDEEGKPVAGVTLTTSAASGAGEEVWIPTRTGQSGADGRFEITLLPDEALQVTAVGEGYRQARVPVATPRAEVEVRLARVSADAQKRLEEIQKELAETYQAFASAKDDAERQALLQRMRALQKEQAELQGKER